LAAGTPQILLPWDNAAVFQSNLEAYTGGRIANWTAWIVPTTLKPADAAKRVGMSEAELRAVNQIPLRMNIKAGSTLLVRRSVGLDMDVAVHVAENGQLSLAPEVILKKTLVKAGKKESVATLAQRMRVSPQNVAEWNKVSIMASFKPGQQVVVFLPAKAAAPQKTLAHNKATTRATKPAPLKKPTPIAHK
jgi:membrane-bound lytic murein transglycosylase D